MMKFLIAVAAAAGLGAHAQAETLEYRAISDFADINAGEVPYYIHGGVSALAINAGQASYRNKFARATTAFNGTPGIYDVTISALGEIDGECEYQFLVNGVVVGSAQNARVDEDYGVQDHTFQDIQIPAGAEIAVESKAVSNGLVPEHDIFAFARGRWTTLTLESDDNAATIDLHVTASVSDNNPDVGETISIDVGVQNNHATNTATNPLLTITTSQLAIDPVSECTLNNGDLSCALAEITPGQTRTLNLTGRSNTSGRSTVTASISADQPDSQSANNSSMIEIDSAEPVVTPLPSVDLAVSVTSNTTSASVGDTISYTVAVVNQHQTNVATAPLAGILLPQGLSFAASSDCTANNQTVSCPLAELAAGESTTAQFAANTNASGNLTLVASVSAAESDLNATDNEAMLSITSIDADRSTATVNPTPKAANTGGGYTSPLTLGALFFISLMTRRRKRKV